MREILFRGKTSDGEWVEGSLILAENYCCILQNEEKVHPMDYPYLDNDLGMIDGKATPVIPETVGQFTGLTDRNGTKIFEGDIVKAIFKPNIIGSYAIGTVIFENGAFKILVYKSENSKEYKEYTDENIKAYPIEHNFIDRGYSIEVIGNIHDNPELMKEGADNG